MLHGQVARRSRLLVLVDRRLRLALRLGRLQLLQSGVKGRPGQLSQAAPSTLMARFLAVIDLPEVRQTLGHAAASSSYQNLACLFRRDDGCLRRRARDAVVAAAAARLVSAGTRAGTRATH